MGEGRKETTEYPTYPKKQYDTTSTLSSSPATLIFLSAMSNPGINEAETKIEDSSECTGVLVGKGGETENGERLPLMGSQRRKRM